MDLPGDLLRLDTSNAESSERYMDLPGDLLRLDTSNAERGGGLAALL